TWLRKPTKPGRTPMQTRTPTHYPFDVKMRAVNLLNDGWHPADTALGCGLASKMSVYSWAQRFRDKGQWALMSTKQRAEHARTPTTAAFETSLPDDPTQLKKQMAKLLVDKAVLKKELELIKKTPGTSQVS
ncbi:terminase gpP N-terminus-related DNA-binding protein, partial [Corynebacterium sp. LK2510]|uniref:terminase gpP N-terminus-related DNA-binding protein n=1 Tax=Corynebacterium sp. LK2510 TaxID=3110472 RepID=UPI0034D06505